MAIKVGIIGAGVVGENFGKALSRVGYPVMFSSRDPQGEHAQRVHDETGIAVGSLSEVIAFGEAVAVAMPAETVLQVAQDYQAQLADKVIIDLANRFGGAAGTSFAQELAAISGGKVVKAFNTIGAEHYLDPAFAGQAATMFIAGDDAGAKRWVYQMAADLGFDVIDAGGLDAAVHLENLARFWVHLIRQGLGRNIAFKLLMRSS